MEAFWARGYEATSMQDLVDCTGINRGSIYATFGDKHQFFVAALKHYDAKHRHDWAEALARDHGPRDAILKVFDQVGRSVLVDGKRGGCLLINTALELAPHDPEVARIISNALQQMENFFQAMIERGQAAGEISRDVAPERTACGLLALLAGLRVFSRSRPEPPLIQSIRLQAEALLD